MKLTQNEKQILKHILDNARSADHEIASELKIAEELVKDARKRLEESIIESYTVKVNYGNIGIQTFAIGISRLTEKGLGIGELEIEKKLLEIPNIIDIYRIPRGNPTHIILYGFRDIDDLDSFLDSTELKQELQGAIETREFFVFSHNSLIKQSPLELIHAVIDGLNDIDDLKVNKKVISKRDLGKINLNELEEFKKKLR